MTEVLPTVLLVEDDDAIQGIVEEALREGGFEFTSAKTGEEAVTLLKGRLVAYCALVALHSDFDRLGPAVRLAPAGVSDQRGPRCC
ncbi:CheY-like chemotaxis protein, partial [Bradyrhizobium sp. S3.2.12]